MHAYKMMRFTCDIVTFIRVNLRIIAHKLPFTEYDTQLIDISRFDYKDCLTN